MTVHAPTSSKLSTRSRSAARALAAVAAVALAVTLAGCGSGGASSGGSRVKVRTDVFFSGATLPLIVAKQKGFFADEGLDVSIEPGKGSATTLQTVANGSDDIGYADAGVLIQLAAKGASVKMIADMVQQSPLEVVTLAKSGITSPSDLVGKTGGYVDGSAGEQLWPAFAKATGIDPNSVKFVHVDIPTRDSLLLSGKTQFSFGLYNNTEPLLSAKCKCAIRGFRYSDHDIEMLSSGLVTSPDYAKTHADTVRKFLAAVSKAVTWSQQNPDTAVKAFMAGAGSTTLTPAVVKQQWLNSAKLLHSKRTKGEPFGCMSEEDWKSSVALMGKYAGVDTSKLDPSALWTNDYLKGCA
jgi:NitT/TauT family transport system substrate-binding protein